MRLAEGLSSTSALYTMFFRLFTTESKKQKPKNLTPLAQQTLSRLSNTSLGGFVLDSASTDSLCIFREHFLPLCSFVFLNAERKSTVVASSTIRVRGTLSDANVDSDQCRDICAVPFIPRRPEHRMKKVRVICLLTGQTILFCFNPPFSPTPPGRFQPGTHGAEPQTQL